MSAVTVNSGSTSVKLALYDISTDPPVQLAAQHHSGRDLEATTLLRGLEAQLHGAPQVIAHRIVHGGIRFTRPTRLTPDVMAAVEALSPLAPLHNPLALRWVAASRQLWPQALQVAVFDTAFFADLPHVAAEYALAPQLLGPERAVRRYGFHGLAHEAMWSAWSRLYPDLPRGGRLITLQLGGGCSIAAIERGQPLDTSMGFSPLEGLVMATRSGDIDPAIIPYLQSELALTAAQIVELLNTQSGLKGLSGTEADPEALLADPSPSRRFAAELYCYRIRKYVGAYLAVLGGCDGIMFGGGVGEHAAQVRARALAGLAWAGIVLDPARNLAARGGAARIDDHKGAVHVHVGAADEEQVLAHAAAAALKC